MLSKFFGILSIIFAIVGTPIFVFLELYHKETISLAETLLIISVGGIFFILGAVLIASTKLQFDYEEKVQFAQNHGLHDDLSDLANGKITTTLILTVATGLLVIFYTGYYLYYDKLLSNWNGWNVTLIGIVLSVILGAILISTEWFKNQYYRTPSFLYVVVVGGVLLSVIGGVYTTEPIQRNSDDYGYYNTRSASLTSSFTENGRSSSFVNIRIPSSTPSCTGKNCGAAYVIIFIILIVIAVCVASLFVTHFWVAGGMVLLTILVILLIQDLRAIAPQSDR